jgi:hypothetical protein
LGELELDEADGDDAEVAMCKQPLMSTGRFLNTRKHMSLACASETSGAQRVSRVIPEINITRYD